MNWSAFPFVRATCGLIAGILLKETFNEQNLSAQEIVLFAAVIFMIYFSLVRIYRTHRVGQLTALVTVASFVMLGFMSATFWESSHRPSYIGTDLEKVSGYTVIVRSNPSPTEKTIRYEVQIDRLKMDDTWIGGREQAILYFMGDSTGRYRFGDKLFIKGSPEFVQQNTNPHAFNYGKYLQRRGIYLQDFVEAQNTIFMGKPNVWSIKYWSIRAGDQLEAVLAKNISGPREFQVAKAMVLGRREDITSEMEFAYQSTGTSHILAVSGLHVGIVYMLFAYIFQYLKNRNRWIYNGIILLAIWSFAFITGLSPSVQRAAIMLSIFLAAGLFSRRSNAYNSILISVFTMLLYAPNLLFSVSFQLSYLAVFGILYIYNLIYQRLYFKYAVPDFIWKITSVSIAVQIATFPVTIFYFKQFPTLFFLTNLVAIPTAMLVLGGSMVLFAFSFVDSLAEFIGKLLETWVYHYNELLFHLSHFSLTAIEDLYLKTYVTFAILIITFLLIRLFEKRDILVFRVLVLVLITFAVLRIYEAYQTSNQKQLVFYDVNKNFYFDIFYGDHCYTNAIDTDPFGSAISYNIIPNRKYRAIRSVQPVDNCQMARKIGDNLLLSLEGKMILVLQNSRGIPENIKDLKLDFLLVNMSSLKKIEGILPELSVDFLILDNSVSENTSNKLMLANKCPYPVHSIRKSGAYIVDI